MSSWAAEAPPVVVAVFGDSMADGLWGGLFRAWHTDSSLSVLRRAKNGTGLGHPAKYDWQKGTGQIIAEDKPDIAVVSIGLNDRVSIVTEDKAVVFGSKDWKKAYTDRVDGLMSQLHQANIPTFWVGLPVMRDDDARRDAKLLNAIFAECATKNGVTFLPMWDIAGSGDDYAAYGKDKDGRQRQLRAEDGTHYTAQGYDMLAEHLGEVLKPVIAGIKAKPKVAAAPPAPAPPVVTSPAPAQAAHE